MLPDRIIDALPNDRALVAARFGLFLVLINDQFVSRSILFAGEYSSDELQLLVACCRPNFSVIEVGSHIGTLSIPLANHLKSIGGKLYTYEPQRNLYNVLCANLALNAIDNVVAKCVALSDERYVKACAMPVYSEIGNFGGVELKASQVQCSEGDATPVQFSTLDDEHSSEHQKIGLIKIDVEGMELEVLKGAQKIIERDRPILYVENDREENSELLLKYIGDMNYCMYWHLPKIIEEDNFFGYSLTEAEKIVSINVLAVPSELNLTIDGLAKVNSVFEFPGTK